MNIRDVHGYLAETLLPTLSISSPKASTIRRVYKYLPAARQALTDLPCAMLTYEMQEVRFAPSLLQQRYAVNVRLVAGKVDVDADVAADVAAAFGQALILAVSDNLTAGGTLACVNGMRGASETLALWEWAGQGYVGLDLFLDCQMSETRQHGP